MTFSNCKGNDQIILNWAYYKHKLLVYSSIMTFTCNLHTYTHTDTSIEAIDWKYVMTLTGSSKRRHGAKTYIMTSKNVMTSKSSSWRQKYVMMWKGLFTRQQVRHYLKKCVMLSQICHDVKEFVMTSNVSSLRQQVHHAITNTCTITSKNASWYQKYVMTSKRSSRVNNTSWRQKYATT